MKAFVLRFILVALCVSGFKTQAPNENTKEIEVSEEKVDVQIKLLEMKMQLVDLDNRIVEQNAELLYLKMMVLKLSNGMLKWEVDPVTGKIEESGNPKNHCNEDNDEDCQENDNRKQVGTTFTRWGRTTCPYNTSIVYKGFIGGSHYSAHGGAAEYVCLPEDPTWNDHKSFRADKRGFIYGAEYEILPDVTMDHYSAVCVVCEAPGYSMNLMIPGRDQCYPGWNEAYHGELASGNALHDGPSEYICLDSEPEKGQNKNGGGKLLYSVHAKSGALACPPYEDEALLTCVVCLK